MKRIMAGVLAGLSIWLGSALAAEAQQITPTGPMHIQATDASVVYSATITTNFSFNLYLTVKKNGTTVYNCQWFCVNSGPSYNFQSPVLSTSTWGMRAGDTINFHVVVQITPTIRSTNDYNVPVEPGSTTMAPSTKTDVMVAQALLPRKNEYEELLAATEGSVA